MMDLNILEVLKKLSKGTKHNLHCQLERLMLLNDLILVLKKCSSINDDFDEGYLKVIKKEQKRFEELISKRREDNEIKEET